ncbi:MAG TPA: glycosyltransferase family 2 protein [Dongiaceae bacterium]|nr:glycosyltransferase family 2 protein [Dongiaceae bacterium]
MTALFVAAALLLVHAYIGYPLSLLLLALFRPASGPAGPGRPEETPLPTVTLLVSAYNEERCLGAKLENCAAIDYPRDRLRTIVVSDGSSDATEAIARAWAGRGVELIALPGRRGKVACLNEVVPTLASDLVVMSDANSMYEPDALRRLVAHFGSEEIGCVCGQLAYTNPRRQAAGEGERIYWGYEGLIKRLESRLGSLLGANGAIYAYRRSLFRQVDPLTFCDDVIPIRVAMARYRVIYDSGARCTEETAPEEVELRRRRRHASFGMRSMRLVMREAVAAGRWLLVYQCLSHRVLRWLGGVALLLMAAVTPWLPAPWRLPALGVQGGFYALAATGWALDRLGLRFRPAYLAYYVLAIHAAGLTGLWRLLSGTDAPHWEPRQ